MINHDYHEIILVHIVLHISNILHAEIQLPYCEEVN